MTDTRDSALRPLHAVWDARTALREGIADPDAARAAVLRVADAVEASLRRLLRDDPHQPLETRLRAQDPDELGADGVIAALRQRDRISIELAAAVHDLVASRRRLRDGADAYRADVDLVCGVADRTEREIHAVRAPLAPPPDPDTTAEAPGPRGNDDLDPPRSLAGTQRGLPPSWVAVAAVALLLVVAAVVLIGRGRGPRMDEAIALFRTGDYDRAAEQFERHAADRPGDPTPRLFLARIYRRTARYEDANEQLRVGLEAAPDDPALHRELGFLLLDTGRADAAAGRFRRAVELDPESSEGWLGLVRALRESGQDAAAERVLARAPAGVRERLQPQPAVPAPR